MGISHAISDGQLSFLETPDIPVPSKRKKPRGQTDKQSDGSVEQVGFLTELSSEDESSLKEHARRLKLRTLTDNFGTELLRSMEIDEHGMPTGEMLDDYQYTPEQVIAMHDHVLHHTLYFLGNSHTSEMLWQEIFDWISTPLVHPVTEANKHPFSFQACCNACAYDSEELQDMLLKQMLASPPSANTVAD
jgi:hypothetical protein